MTSESAPDPNPGDRTRVFVSYAREDAAFVDGFKSELRLRSVEPLLDREQIAHLEDWRERIVGLIGEAHTIVFVLSPSWLGSEECHKELDVALEMQKRLAPVLHREVVARDVPPALARLNWISFVQRDAVGASLDDLVQAFTTDIEWIREAARIAEQARYWSRDGKPEGGLLRDAALIAAERLLAGRPATAPAPTDLLTEYLRVARDVQEREERSRKELLERTLVSQSRMLADRSRQVLSLGDAVSAALLALEALPDQDEKIVRPFVRDAATACSDALAARHEQKVFASPRKLSDAAVSSDGGRVLGLTNDGVAVWEVVSGELVATLDGDRVLVAADGTRVATVHGDIMEVWDLPPRSAEPRLVETLPPRRPTGFEHLFSDAAAALVDRDGRWGLTNLGGPDPFAVRTPPLKREEYETAAFSPDGKRVVATPNFDFSFPTTVRTWNAETGAPIAELRGHRGYVHGAEFSPDGTRIVTASFDRTARIWDADTGKLRRVLRGHEDDVACARFSLDGTMVVTASYDNSCRVWHVATGKPIAVLRGHAGEVPKTTDMVKGFRPSARFGPDGTHVVTTWQDGTARLWKVRAGSDLRAVLTAHRGEVRSVAFDPAGARFATASADKTIVVWDAATKNPVRTLGALDDTVDDVAFSADGARLAAAVGREVVVWDARTFTELARIEVEYGIRHIAFSPDGTRLATASMELGAVVWDLATGQRVSRSSVRDSEYCVSFAPSGLVAVSCGDAGTIRVWYVATGKEIYAARLHGHSVMSVAFDHRGQRIVTGCDDQTSRIWRVGTDPNDQNVVVLSGHDRGVYSAAFDSSGEYLVTASEDETVRLWHAATGAQLAVFEGHTDHVWKAVFSPSGQEIVSVSQDKTVRVWTTFASPGALVGYAKRVMPRALTPEQRAAFHLEPRPPSWCVAMRLWPYGGEARATDPAV